MKLRKTFLAMAILLGLLASPPCFGEDPSPSPTPTPEKKKKELNFDGEIVEGVYKQPLDSLNQFADQDDAKNKQHLYRKRASYREENLETIRELVDTY
jgi:hypothetical protein